MMKKVWLALLAVVLVFGLVMVGCGGGGKDDDDDDDDLVEKVVFELATDAGIQALALGELTFADGDAGNPIKPLVKAGNISEHISSFKAVAGPGDQKVALEYVTVANWGPGIDLPFAAFGFRAGDKITVTGTKVGSGAVSLNTKVGGNPILLGSAHTEEGAFTFEGTLSDTDVTNIKAGGPAGIRIEDRAGGQTITITNIKIEGKRPSNLKKLAAPVIAIEDGVVSWTDIDGASGYKVLSKLSTDEEFSTLVASQVTATITVSNMFAVSGTYQIKVIALGTTGSTTDSDESNVVEYVAVIKPLPVGVSRLGALTDTKWWGTSGSDATNGLINLATFAAAKYLILDVTSIVGEDGFGGIQLAIQSQADSWAWHEANGTKGWSKPETGNNGWELSNSDPDDFYIVIDLTSITGWDTYKTAEFKIALNSVASQITVNSGYIATATAVLTFNNKLDSSVAGGVTSFAVKTIPEL